MKKFSRLSYSQKIQKKNKIKTLLICSTAILCAFGSVCFTVILALHCYNSQGVGGPELHGNPELVEEIISQEKNTNNILIDKTTDQSSVSLLQPQEKITESQNSSLQNITEEKPEAEISEPAVAATEEESEEALAKLFEHDETQIQQDKSNTSRITYFSYRVKKGDMIGFIADEFGITQDTIISVNNIHQSRLLQIGQYLKIPSMPGILYTVRNGNETIESISTKYNVDMEKCALANNISYSEPLNAGKTLFIPDAKLDWVTRQEINGDLFKKPIHQRFYFTSMYGWRQSPFDSNRRTFHSGIDMACRTGTPVYPALEGTITSCGYNDTYGNYVIITHHSGYKTLYGHMSKITASKGMYVTTDKKIGEVGSTGLSTGPHLHITVYKNGRTVNPANLWK